jgi:hypothetical protein
MHESAAGPFRTWSDVRLESVVRTEADSADYYRFTGSRLENSQGQKAEITDRQTHFRFTLHLKRGIDSPSQGSLRMAGTELQSRRKVLVISA